MRTQVAIVGAGPAGLLLSHLLHLRGIESVVIEARSREYVEHRVRAGVLEQGTVDTLVSSGAGERLLREGLVHHGIELRFGGQGHRIAFEKLVPGRAITVYGQQEVVKDLIEVRLAAGGQIFFDAGDVVPKGIEGPHPEVSFTDGGAAPRRPGRLHRRLRRVPRNLPRRDPARRAAVLRQGVPVRLARRARRRGAVLGGTDLRQQRARLRPAQHAQPRGEPVLPAGGAGRGHRRLARRPDLGRTRGAAGDRAGLEPGHRPGPGEGHHGHAQLRGRADAVRAAAAGRRRGPHRAADRSQGPEPRRVRRHRADRGPRRLVLLRRNRSARRVLAGLPAPGLAGPALLLVDDHAAAHVRPLRRLRPPPAAVVPGLRVQFGRGRHVAGRELRGPGPAQP